MTGSGTTLSPIPRPAGDASHTTPPVPVAHRRAEAEAHDRSWAWQVVSGALVLVLVSVHMVAQHFVVPGGLRDFAAVVSWLSNPVVIGVELAFLTTVLWHGLLGLRAILFDLGFSPRAERRLTRILAAVWVATVGYGLWLMWVIVAQT
jgi:succinate dehydrogenase hydrophobic anchor subunit